MAELETTCEYCGAKKPVAELETRNGRFVCRDVKACDEVDDRRHRQHITDLRKRRREGDEVSEAESQELADG